MMGRGGRGFLLMVGHGGRRFLMMGHGGGGFLMMGRGGRRFFNKGKVLCGVTDRSHVGALHLWT